LRSNEKRGQAPKAVLLASEQWVTVTAGVPVTAVGGGRASAERRAWSVRNAHGNANREILLAVRGSGWFGMGDLLYPCRPGSLFLIDPGIMHDNFYPDSAGELEHIWLRILGNRVIVNWLRILGGRYSRLHEPLAVLTHEQLGIVPGVFPDDTLPLVSPADIVRLRLLVALIAVYLAERIEDVRDEPGAEDAAATIQEEVTEAIRRHIDETSGKGVSLEFLAHFSGYSKFHLHRFFRARAGCTIHQYMDTARVRKERQMKAAGAVNAEIAEALGFSDSAAYLRWRRRRPADR
jgi:AraC family transcriptional activator of mar-sox-rob regulon